MNELAKYNCSTQYKKSDITDIAFVFHINDIARIGIKYLEKLIYFCSIQGKLSQEKDE